jgi:NAD/NADP transhydrogenase beta subunit
MILSITIFELVQSTSGTWDDKHVDRDQEFGFAVHPAASRLRGMRLDVSVAPSRYCRLLSLSKDITRLFPDAPIVMVIEEKYHLAQNSANLCMETNQGV